MKDPKKKKKIKKEISEDEDYDSIDEKEEEEEASKNEYDKDDSFLDDGNEEEEENDDNRGQYRIQQSNSIQNKEAEIDEDLGSSDIEVIQSNVKKKKKKIIKKSNKVISDDDEDEIIKKEKVYEEDERNNIKEDNFIEDDQEIKSEGENDINEDKNYNQRDYNNYDIPHQIFKIPEIESEEKKKISYNQIFPLVEIEEQFATQEDIKIKKEDLPERLLLKYKREEIDNLFEGLEFEKEWIFEKLKLQNNNSEENFSNIKKKIFTLLEYHKKNFLDIPYIVYYRKYIYEPEMDQKDVWKLFELDREYQEIKSYRKEVLKKFEIVKQFLNEETYNFMKQRYIDNAKSIEDLKNMELYIKFQRELNEDKINEMNDLKNKLDNNNLNDNNLDNNLDNNNFEKFDFEKLENYENQKIKNYIPPIKQSLIKKLVKNKINEFTSKFALKSQELALNLELILNDPNIDNSKLIPTPNPNQIASELAEKYKSEDFPQTIDVMNYACKFLSIEIQSHPFLRQYIWQFFRNNCYLSTEPTELGQKELDIFNRAFRTKRLEKKPINSFNNDLYLDILQSEKKGLIKVKIEIILNDTELEKIISPIKKAYTSSNDDNYNNEDEYKWKVLREEALSIFFREEVYKQFENEIKKELEKKAEEYVIEECGNKFMDLLNSGPYRKRIIDNNDDEKFKDNNLPRVLSFVYDNNNNITYSVMLNKNGEVIDHFSFNYLHHHYSNMGVELKKEQENCKNIIHQHKPDLIIIGANDLKCRFLKDNINNCDQDLLKKKDLWVTYGDLSIPRIYANSIYGDNSFPKYNLYLRQAVSLGRYQQNPLEEILQLWNENRNKNYCLKINLHPLQNEVNQSKLIEKLEYKAIEVVNSIGVDINKAFEFIHLRNTLMFVSGLGPRKAQYIIEKISPQNGLVSRIELSIRKIIGPIIRTCCTPFIKIKTDITNANNDNKKFNLLDMTRIPLDQYPNANNIIAFVSEEKLNDKESNQSQIEEIIKNPTKLELIDENEYFINNSNKQNINIKELKFYFKLIKKEILNPYSDPRKQRKDLKPEQIFHLLIGDENFQKGQITVAKVLKVDKQHVQCRLMNDLKATLWIKDIFEENKKGTYEEMKERYKEGTVFEARIKDINYIKFKVDLETRPSSMRDHSKYLKSDQLDPYFNYIPDEDTKNLKYIEKTKQQHHKYIPRNITMEKFRNVGYLGVKEILRNKDIGECIFRPSSRGHDHLTLSWKFYKFIIAHVDIIEHDKLPGASIGSRLQIGDDYYSSLNEIIERYVNACANLVRNAIQNRKFINCEKVSEFENKLKEEKQKSLSIINYHFTILPEFPSYIVLGYVPKVNPVLEYIKVKPKGLYFHNRYSNDLDSIISFFKSNYGSESYYDFVRKVRPPTIEYYRNIENDYGRRDDNNDNVIVQNTDNSYNRNRPETRTCNICHKKGHIAKDCPNKREYRDRERDRERERERDREKEAELTAQLRELRERTARYEAEAARLLSPEEEDEEC